MSRSRLYGIVIAVVLAVSGGGVAALVLLTSGKASNVELTSARYVPADAAAFIGLNTDLTSTQWIAAFAFAKRLGQKNPQQDLHQAASDSSGVDWTKDVAPFLGGDAAVYVHSFDLSGSVPSGAIVLRCKDAARAMTVLEKQTGLTLTDGTHDGVRYRYTTETPFYAARFDGYLAVASDEQSLFDVLDVRAGKKPNLASVADFKTLRDDLTNTFLGFVYINTNQLLTQSVARIPAFKTLLQSAGTSKLAVRPSALVIGARSGSLEFQTASIVADSAAPSSLQPRDSRLAHMVPATTSVFVSSAGLGDLWQQFRKSAGSEFDDALSQQGYDGGVAGLLQSAADQFGVSGIDDVMNLFTGEVAVAGWLKSGSVGDATGVLLAEVKDEKKAKSTLDAVVQSAGGGTPKTERSGKAQLTIVPQDSGTDLAYAVTDGYLVIGTHDGVKTMLAQPGDTLADSAAYKRTVAQMPAKLGTFVYVDIAALVKQSSLVPGGLGGAEQYLQGLIINLVQDRGISRLTGVLTAQQ